MNGGMESKGPASRRIFGDYAPIIGAANQLRRVGEVDFYESLKSRTGALAVRDFNIRKNPCGKRKE